MPFFHQRQPADGPVSHTLHILCLDKGQGIRNLWYMCSLCYCKCFGRLEGCLLFVNSFHVLFSMHGANSVITGSLEVVIVKKKCSSFSLTCLDCHYGCRMGHVIVVTITGTLSLWPAYLFNTLRLREKWPTFRRQHVHMHFLEWKYNNFY